MSSDVWIDETLYDAWGQRFRVKQELARFKSAFQDIVIFDSETHGRVLMLDGIVQITERDEFVYQEMMVHVPLIAHGAARRVLIIGAGDGGVLRRVLQHSGLERVVMVEIDDDVIRLSKAFLPGIAGNAWHDTRAEVIIGDGIDFVSKAATGSFDVILVDSTDPVGVGEVLFTDAFYKHCERALTDNGIIVNQCGVPFMQAEELRQSSLRRGKFFPHVAAYVVAVPSYVGGFMTLGIAAKGLGSLQSDAGLVRNRAGHAGILGQTRYWTPEMHISAFALPPYISEQLPGQ